jgi:hypothetical protein
MGGKPDALISSFLPLPCFMLVYFIHRHRIIIDVKLYF